MLCAAAVPIHAKNLPRGVLYRARLWCEVESFLWGPRKSYALTKPHTSANANNKVRRSCLCQTTSQAYVRSCLSIVSNISSFHVLGDDVLALYSTCRALVLLWRKSFHSYVCYRLDTPLQDPA